MPDEVLGETVAVAIVFRPLGEERPSNPLPLDAVCLFVAKLQSSGTSRATEVRPNITP